MPKTLSKTDLVAAIARGAELPKVKAEAALGALVDAVVTNVSKGNTVRVPQLGSWTRVNRKARTARNPQTGAPVKVPATKVPKFSASAGFKDLVAGKVNPAAKKAGSKGAAARKPATKRAATRKR